MKSFTIRKVEARDRRFPLHDGAGTDAVHVVTEYAFAETRLLTGEPEQGRGIVLTLGRGNDLVCRAIELLAEPLAGREIEELMAGFGAVSRQLADHAELRWLGPHKGVIHLALASLTNACFDLWAKARGVPLWKLLLSLPAGAVVNLLDLSYLEDVLPPAAALRMLEEEEAGRASREQILVKGYPGYDTSVGWFQYEDSVVREKARRALENGFQAFKLKVGSKDPARDLRRAAMLRELVGPECRIMFDANQQWTLPRAESFCDAVGGLNPYWIEEPTHPDDVEAHAALARRIAPMRIALGEHVPNRVMFKNFLARGAVHFVQADCTRLAGIPEFLTVSMLARKHDLPLVPHVGDMGQIHQHLVLFNHIALGLDALFLEYIPHMREHFLHPAVVEAGVYRTPQTPGCGADLKA
ncbi:MAG: mandelate racemase [Bryobacterales bacterium]|nr:mandelate racemase [Bryobacterales bacterium]